MRDPGSIDLNLLRMLRALIETRSITRSGEKLGLSQPAASRIVAKLRYILQDPLLIRTANGYALTPVAVALRPKVLAAVAAADAVFAPTTFDSAVSERTFRIATTDYGSLTVIAPLASYLLHHASGISLNISGWQEGTLQDLENGDLDLALYADSPVPPDFRYARLFVDTYAAIARIGHPIATVGAAVPEVFLQELARYPQIVARYPSGRSHVPDDVLERLGAPPHRNRIGLPYFNTAPLIIAETDAVMVLPRRVADRFATMLPLTVLPVPADREEFAYGVIWHDRAHRDAGVRWLVASLLSVFAQAAASNAAASK